MIDAAFWASLRREEGVTPTISLALLPPEGGGQAITFARRSAAAAVGARQGRAGGRAAGHSSRRLAPRRRAAACGARAASIPAFCVVVEVVASGLLVIKHRNDPFGKFVNVAVLEGDQIKIVDEGFSSAAGLPGAGEVAARLRDAGPLPGHVDVLVQLAASMRAHHRGGALLVVPAGTDAWRESIVGRCSTPSIRLRRAGRARGAREARSRTATNGRRICARSIAAIAGLTAVDGATIITDTFELMAFGAKITRRRGSPPVERVVVTEPVEGSETEILGPTQLGGTRHLSAAQFVHDQRDAIALVASQDGRFTIFKWAPREDMVHAHRVEALLI